MSLRYLVKLENRVFLKFYAKIIETVFLLICNNGLWLQQTIKIVKNYFHTLQL